MPRTEEKGRPVPSAPPTRVNEPGGEVLTLSEAAYLRLPEAAVGSWKDDPHLDEMLKEIYRRRF
jgi:hypothetical protein